jgi:zinc transport system substrate-binding protein
MKIGHLNSSMICFILFSPLRGHYYFRFYRNFIALSISLFQKFLASHPLNRYDKFMIGLSAKNVRKALRDALLPALGALFFAAFYIFMAAGGPAFGKSPGTLKVMNTIFPLQEFAGAVGGDKVQAELLLPPGAEAHNWEPKPSDFGKIAKADVFICIGPMMEPWAAKVLKAVNNPRLSVVEVSSGLALLEAKEPEADSKHPPRGPAERYLDPHLWLDFSLDAKILDSIARVFGERDPAQAPFYRDRAEAYKQRLADLDRAYRKNLAVCQRRQIIIGGHSAFAYLARRYDLEQVALYGLSPNAEPTPKKLAGVIETARQNRAKYIFFEAFVNSKLAQVLAKEAGIGTLVLHTGHNLTREQLAKNIGFLDLMKQNLENLARGLDCHGQ